MFWANENISATCSCQCSTDDDRVVEQLTDLQERLICVKNILETTTGDHGANHRAVGQYYITHSINQKNV